MLRFGEADDAPSSLGRGSRCTVMSNIRQRQAVAAESSLNFVEIGDLCWYIYQLCEEVGYTMEEARKDNIGN